MNIYESIRLVPNDKDLAEWKAAWDLQDLPSPHLLCRACGAIQAVQERNVGFQHDSGCEAFCTSEQLPWRDLFWILENISTEKR